MLAVRIFWFFGELGVNLFMLITGYFQVNSRFKWEKAVALSAQMLFYNALVGCIGALIGTVRFSSYWFFRAYIVIYLLSPYANLLIRNMNEKTFRRFLLALLALYSVAPTILGIANGDPEDEMWFFYNRMVWLFIIYFVGAYIRLHSLALLQSMKCALTCTLGAFSLMSLSIIAIYALDKALGISFEVAYFWPPNTVPMFILSVSVFCVFLQLNVPYAPWINRVASTTFGIYLFHTGGIMQQWLWETLLRFPEKSDSPTLIPQMLAACACIFLIGMLIDFARQALERVTLKPLLSSAWFQRLETRFDMNVMEKET